MANVNDLNTLGRDEFTRALAPVFEDSPWVAERTADKRPLVDRVELHAALCETVMKASNDEKLSLIRAHPDLVGRDLLTPESKSEQAHAGLGSLSPDEIERFREYNARYRERFGFPFVICARRNKKKAILDAFPVRLQNSREQEIETALREIFKIADLRLKDLVE
jgi:2-oxo-4-hydroxy-4-carboxy-5-ureidoimidazoline decarboxylase